MNSSFEMLVSAAPTSVYIHPENNLCMCEKQLTAG